MPDLWFMKAQLIGSQQFCRAFFRNNVRVFGGQPTQCLRPRSHQSGRFMPTYADKVRLFLRTAQFSSGIIRRYGHQLSAPTIM